MNQKKKILNKWQTAAEQRKGIKVSKTLRDIIHGYIMSDGYVSQRGGLQVDQSTKQKKFVEWLYWQLEPLRTQNPISIKTRIQKRSGKHTYSACFQTRNLLIGFRHMWYKPYINHEGKTKYRKVLPKSLPCIFNAIFITLWFAGDGTKMKDQRGAKFEVTSLTPPERKRLQSLFKTKFDITVQINRAGVNKNGTEQWSLNINSSEYDKFRSLITEIDLIPTLFAYKLHSIKNP